jgi:RP/EB family microtubule-associated protein
MYLLLIGVFFQLLDLKLSVDGLEKERDFYFGKLREIELMCQEDGSEKNPLIQKILDILYATEVSKMSVI